MAIAALHFAATTVQLRLVVSFDSIGGMVCRYPSVCGVDFPNETCREAYMGPIAWSAGTSKIKPAAIVQRPTWKSTICFLEGPAYTDLLVNCNRGV